MCMCNDNGMRPQATRGAQSRNASCRCFCRNFCNQFSSNREQCMRDCLRCQGVQRPTGQRPAYQSCGRTAGAMDDDFYMDNDYNDNDIRGDYYFTDY